LEDLGSGSLIDLSPWGLHDEPTVPEVVRSGVDVVTFSGDKVLGGPQAGIIVGKKEYISRMKRNQLLRALRCDKLTLAALEATLRLYRDRDTALSSIPTLRRLTMRPDELQSRAETLCGLLRPALERNGAPLAELQLRKDFSRVGGGSFPEQGMATTLVCVKPLSCSATELKERLLAVDIPVIGRLEGEYFMLDPRTLDDAEFETIAAMLAAALA
ncbi:MAG: L-seryl-tRNA(Sec) selenium transferase, partial [Mailhella sp.]|nr:L-seryl-tRNA(Sec) selenium transferase [Mailhella sp.]